MFSVHLVVWSKMKSVALLLFLANVWAVSGSCPNVTNFEDGSMVKYLGETGIEEIRFMCAPGKFILGEATIVCVSGSWSHEIPVCQNVSRCSNLLPPDNGAIESYEFNITDGTIVVKFGCEKGYMLDDFYDPVIRCDGKSGVWTNSVPLCKHMTACDPVPAPENGTVKILEGSSLQDPFAVIGFKCYSGYHLVGEQRLRCNGTGFWNDEIPTCERTMRCPSLPTPANGGYIPLYSSNEGNKRVLFYCNEGYMVEGTEYSRCIKGTWLNLVPTCVVHANCPVPTPDPSVNMLPISTTYEDRSIISFTCAETYHVMYGPSSLFCSGGKWQGPLPICKERRCPPLMPPNDGSITINDRSDEPRPGTVATFACNDGLVYFGEKTITCRQWGSWTHSRRSVCARNVSCPIPSVPNASVNQTTWSRKPVPEVDSTVVVKCNPGFDPRWNQYRTCEPGGKWSNKPVTCKAKPVCPPPRPMMHSTIQSSFTTFWSDSFVRISCDPGYKLVGRSVMYCRKLGDKARWDKSPRCIPDGRIQTHPLDRDI